MCRLRVAAALRRLCRACPPKACRPSSAGKRGIWPKRSSNHEMLSDWTHGGKDLVMLARERFGHKLTETAAAAGDKHDLCWVHDEPLVGWGSYTNSYVNSEATADS